MSDQRWNLEPSRALINARVRNLRLARRMRQQDLAERLGLSQSRLSQIERGDGSFTAEQFLQILRIFNVGVEEFDDRLAAADGDLQNALIRHGATHLRQVELIEFLASMPQDDGAVSSRDTLDPGIRSTTSLERTWTAASAISRKWRIVSSIGITDFADALRRC